MDGQSTLSVSESVAVSRLKILKKRPNLGAINKQKIQGEPRSLATSHPSQHRKSSRQVRLCVFYVFVFEFITVFYLWFYLWRDINIQWCQVLRNK